MTQTPDLPYGWRLDVLPEVDSTNAEVLRRAEHGEAEGLAIRTDVQTAGRGRRGRRWESPKGNLYLSVLVDAQLAKAGQVGFAAALALIDALEIEADKSLPNLRCKWPNDLVLNGAKVAGLLLEAVPEREQVVVGLGVNLITTAVKDAVYRVGTLADIGVAFDVEILSARICVSLQSWLETWRLVSFTPLRKAWLQAAEGLNQPITVQLPHETFEGKFHGLSDDGALVLDQGDAVHRIVPAGDVFFAHQRDA